MQRVESDAATPLSVSEHTPGALELAPTLSSNASMGRHVRRASSIAGQRAQKAQAESRRAANAVMQQAENEQIDKSGTSSRYIPWNQPDDSSQAPKFEKNAVSTAKYDTYFLTFVPLFLFEMFSRVAYLYFLIQASLSWWGTVSPFAGYGSTAALAFVLLAAAIKAIVEDRKRQAEDHKLNTSITYVIDKQGGQWVEKETRWMHVKVGDIVKVRDGDLFPADLMCMHCDLPERICYVKTTNLDGETNLKVKRQVLEEEDYSDLEHPYDVLNLSMDVEAEFPNSNLHNFRGRVRIKRHDKDIGRVVPITMNQMLLRGCMLKNSHFVLGQVVYTGSETRIQMNSAAAPLKIGSFDHFLNMQVAILILAQVLLCIICAILNFVWRETEGKRRYYLEFESYTEGNRKNGFLYTLLSFITFWILFSYLVPISLFVTLEIVKFWQGFVFINFDRNMKDRSTGEAGRCRNSNLNEDLGKIDYIFSDKTGTLTSNEMRLRLIAIKGEPLGDLNKNLESRPDLTGFSAIKYFSDKMYNALQAIQNDKEKWHMMMQGAGSPQEILALKDSHSGPAGASFGPELGNFLPYHLVDFWMNLALCHALLVDTSDGQNSYQGPSPDEVALVECARTLGFEFVRRTATHTILNILGQEVQYETLEVMEFSSERQRMSVIVRAPDGTIKICCKGADAMMLKRINSNTSPDLLSRVKDNLHFFATKGLRTLVIGTRTIPPDVYADWSRRYDEAQGQVGVDNQVEEKCMDEIESQLELIGVTAIEDKLQDEVPESIAKMISAGVKVWMITGDKQETAINIAVSCRLFNDTDSLLICNAGSKAAASEKMSNLTNRARGQRLTLEPTQLVIDGKTLTHILKDRELEKQLATLGALCTAVCVCRASPSQKARIVTMMREFELAKVTDPCKSRLGRWFAKQHRNLGGKMLAIGDGANDVAMIQAADVGIGIAGKEGRQAVNNSDYAIPQFRFLTRLLLVHGQLSQYRLGRLIKYSFYKNSCFAAVLFYFQIYNGFSGQTLIDDISAAVYNVIFTSLPILFFSLLDQPYGFDTMQTYPRTYNKSRGLSVPIFWKTGVAHAFLDAAICFFVPFLAASPLGHRTTIDVFSVGKTIFICMLGVVTMEIMIVARYWTWAFAAVCAFSYILVYPYVLFFPIFWQNVFGSWDLESSGVGINIMVTPFFWIALMTVYAMTFSIRYFERSLKWLFRPDDSMILAELEDRERVRELSKPMPDSKRNDLYPVVEDPHAAPAGAAVGESTHPLVAISPTANYSMQGGTGGESVLPYDLSWGATSSASGNTFLRSHNGVDHGDTELGELRPTLPVFLDGATTNRSM